MVNAILTVVLLFMFLNLVNTEHIWKNFVISTFLFYFSCFLVVVFWDIPKEITDLFHKITTNHGELNVILLVPFGFYLVELFNVRKYRILTAICLAIPLVIEISQELLIRYTSTFKYHQFGMDDVVNNFLGCFIAGWLMLTIRKTLLERPKQSSTN